MSNDERSSNAVAETEALNPRTNAEYRDEAMRRMMETAIRLISERGASKLSLVDVGRKAGYSHALPNYYFKSKKRLLLNVYTYIIDQGRVLFRDWARKHIPGRIRPGLSSVQATIRTFFGLVDTALPSIRAMNILWSEAICSMPELLTVVRPETRKFVGFFEYQLRTGIARGEIDPSIDVEAVALVIAGALYGVAAHYMADPEHVNLQKLTEATIDLLNRGITLREANCGTKG
jgi:AcrR family transcriptional regulator